MRKEFIILLLIIMFLPINVHAYEKQKVEFSKCVDGDTAKFILDDDEIKVRFLAIDTPETSHPKKGEEPYGKEAKEFTCDKLKKAKKIEIEFDDNSDVKDKYDRYLAWVFVDDYLLQSELIKNGLAEVAYLYGDYKYTDILKENETNAKLNKVGKFSDVDTSIYTNKKNTKKYDKIIEDICNKMIDKVTNFILSIIEEIF